MTLEEREQVVALLRAGAQVADVGHAAPLLAAAVESGKRFTSIWPYALDVALAVTAEAVGPGVKPRRETYPALLRIAAQRVEEGSWP